MVEVDAKGIVMIAGTHMILPSMMCSESEKWRAQAMIQLTVGVMSDSRVVMIDRADMLDQDGWEGLGEGRGGRHGRQADVGSAVFDRRGGRGCAVASSGDQEGEDMNHENVLKVADGISDIPYGETMNTYGKPKAFNMASGCGSACCVSGWAHEIVRRCEGLAVGISITGDSGAE